MFVKQVNIPMILASDGISPAFKEVPLESIIDCSTPLDNLSETQSRKLAATHERHGTWMDSTAIIKLGSGGPHKLSNFVFQERIGLNAGGNSMATFECITKKSRWYQKIVVVIAQRAQLSKASSLPDETIQPASASSSHNTPMTAETDAPPHLCVICAARLRHILVYPADICPSGCCDCCNTTSSTSPGNALKRSYSQHASDATPLSQVPVAADSSQRVTSVAGPKTAGARITLCERHFRAQCREITLE